MDWKNETGYSYLDSSILNCFKGTLSAFWGRVWLMELARGI